MEHIKELEPQGNKEFPIWLIGDSDPENWLKYIDYVLDDRHPAIHNIWTPILYKIQKKYFDEEEEIFDDKYFYINNAIHYAKKRPERNIKLWNYTTVGKSKAVYLQKNIDSLKKDIEQYSPKMIITFGAFAFEFVRRCSSQQEEKVNKWSTKQLKFQFNESIDNFSITGKVNIVPLLHISISGGHFPSSHKYFSHKKIVEYEEGNYFEFVSELLYPKFREIFESPETQKLIERLKVSWQRHIRLS